MRPRSSRPAPATSSCFLRETLSNIERHADATTCRVSLRRAADGGIELEIDDDGQGFDIDAERTGMGLANLEARVSSMGGTFHAASVAGDGTTITARWPA